MMLEPETPEITTNEDVNISAQEVRKTLEKLKNRTAAGKDGIPNELMKYYGAAMTEQLTTLINKIIKHNKIPEEWRTRVFILLFRKGDKKLPELTTKILQYLMNQRKFSR